MKKVKCIIVAGFAGSGKSTFGMSIAKNINAVYLDKDTLFENLVEKLLREKGSYEGDRESEVYKKEINPLEYESLTNSIVENISLGNDVVVSAPYIHQIQNYRWLEENIVDQFPEGFVDLRVIWIDTDRETEKYRLVVRGLKRDDYKLNNWKKYCEEIENIKVGRGKGYTDSNFKMIDNKRETERMLAERIDDALDWIG